ncbi:MAG: hypothetical protein WC460_02565 [Patescibacteria group bacterium]
MQFKRIFLLFFIIIGCLFLISNAWAYSFTDISGFSQKTATEAGVTQADYTVIIAGVITAVLGVVGAIFFILFIYGGFVWLTSAGSEDKIGKAKKTLSYATVGALIVVGAYALTTFIASSIMSGPSFQETQNSNTTNLNQNTNQPGSGTAIGITCTEQPGGAQCAALDFCLRQLQGKSLGITTDCGNQICCLPLYADEKCDQCGQGATNICSQSECEKLGTHCHFHYIPYNYCEYDPTWQN